VTSPNSKAVLPVVFQTDDYVAVDKPAGLAAIPGRAETDSVVERLARQLGVPCRGVSDVRLRVVHRIDKETTGVMLFAQSLDAQRHASHQFQNNTVAKEYLALVHGRVTEDEGEINAPLAPHPVQRDKMTVAKKGGRPALTRWKVEQRFKSFTLVRVFPKTGKTHQIRVHFAHIGHPLAVDPLYGSGDPVLLSQFKRNYRPTKGQDERPLLARLGLHAYSLTFRDLANEAVTVTAEPPKDWRATMNQLSKL
jgi:23S rRNA pseudouridine955/2504/2580 synthase/23S rRNA pseudouridine1911/1915/1917 synthase